MLGAKRLHANVSREKGRHLYCIVAARSGRGGDNAIENRASVPPISLGSLSNVSLQWGGDQAPTRGKPLLR